MSSLNTSPCPHCGEAIRRPKSPVLVCLHHDGYVEAFARHDVDARIVVIPMMESQAGERLASDYVGIKLPKVFRDIYFPGLMQTCGQVETVRPSDIVMANADAKLLEVIKTAFGDESEVMTWSV
jgi:hypothetical protein